MQAAFQGFGRLQMSEVLEIRCRKQFRCVKFRGCEYFLELLRDLLYRIGMDLQVRRQFNVVFLSLRGDVCLKILFHWTRILGFTGILNFPVKLSSCTRSSRPNIVRIAPADTADGIFNAPHDDIEIRSMVLFVMP